MVAPFWAMKVFLPTVHSYSPSMICESVCEKLMAPRRGNFWPQSRSDDKSYQQKDMARRSDADDPAGVAALDVDDHWNAQDIELPAAGGLGVNGLHGAAFIRVSCARKVEKSGQWKFAAPIIFHVFTFRLLVASRDRPEDSAPAFPQFPLTTRAKSRILDS
jgi:hypothetical protein